MRARALNGEAGRWEKRGRQAPLPRDHFRSFSTKKKGERLLVVYRLLLCFSLKAI